MIRHCDREEFALHIHALQNIVMCREAVRSDPELFYKSGQERVRVEDGS